MMCNSNSWNRSSLQTMRLLRNIMGTTDHVLELGITICFNKSCDKDSSTEMRDGNLSGFRQELEDPTAFPDQPQWTSY
ncbi:hypothetical protein BAE44_0000622 [Dichanthelium oligosanthes]|uniref:Uncharacterized protein n=1 Tax=Dichanthelium oligosanthes TaxID=888268 RepID=A0A1E5WLW1_9POAL|nr:hypothetical protein BAE44_0000622 [Dichanthelium oligosanthes]